MKDPCLGTMSYAAHAWSGKFTNFSQRVRVKGKKYGIKGIEIGVIEGNTHPTRVHATVTVVSLLLLCHCCALQVGTTINDGTQENYRCDAAKPSICDTNMIYFMCASDNMEY